MAQLDRLIVRGRVVRLDPENQNLPWVTVPELGVDRQIGPCLTIQGGVLAPGDPVLCVAVGGTHDDLVVLGKFGGTMEVASAFADLTDVDWPSFVDGEVATYDAATGKMVGLAANAHNHPASAIDSGTFALARLPVADNYEVSTTEVVRADDDRLADLSQQNLMENPGFERDVLHPHYVVPGAVSESLSSVPRSGRWSRYVRLDTANQGDFLIFNGQRLTSAGHRRTVDQVAQGWCYRLVVYARNGLGGSNPVPSIKAFLKVRDATGTTLQTSESALTLLTATWQALVVELAVTSATGTHLVAGLSANGANAASADLRIDDLSLLRTDVHPNTMVRVVYSGSAYPARPAHAQQVEWVGPVQPTISATGAWAGDTWINSA